MTVILVVAFGSVVARGASAVPFAEGFDYLDGTSLDGTNGWGVVGSGSAVATNSRAQLSGATLSNGFVGGEPAVTVSFELQPTFFAGSVAELSIPADATYAFYVKTNGLITAFDGTTPSNLTHTALSETNATSLSVKVDYPAQTWDLSVAGVEVAADLSFYGSTASSFVELGFTETTTNTACYVDSVSVLAATSSVVVHSLPFYEPFESLSLGDLDGQNGWVASDEVVVQSDTVFSGSKAAEYLCVTNSFSTRVFDGSHSNVWTDMRLRPVFGGGGTPPSGSTFGFYVQTNGHLYAYDGGSAQDLTAAGAVTISEGAWTRFTVHSDYSTKKWDLYVNGFAQATNLAFYSDSAVRYSEFGVQYVSASNEVAQSAFLDNLAVQLTQPDGLYVGVDGGLYLLIR